MVCVREGGRMCWRMPVNPHHPSVMGMETSALREAKVRVQGRLPQRTPGGTKVVYFRGTFFGFQPPAEGLQTSRICARRCASARNRPHRFAWCIGHANAPRHARRCNMALGSACRPGRLKRSCRSEHLENFPIDQPLALVSTIGSLSTGAKYLVGCSAQMVSVCRG